MVAGTWVVVASVLAGAGTLALIGRLWRYRDKPGAGWFLVALSAQVVWSLGYGTALLVFQPTLRWALEVVVWVSMAGLIAAFVAFALEYTGRATLRNRRGIALVVAAPVAMGVVTATNPIHGLAWTGFALDPVAGLATVSYDLHWWAVLGTTGGVILASLGSLLLFDTVLSYGPLYRREAIAVGLSTIPPSVALLVWLYGLGPTPELNLATVFFLPHVVLDAYAFVGNDMFEFHPATRRAGERAAIEDLPSPVVIVDERGRIVTVNAAAATVLEADKRDLLTTSLASRVDVDGFDVATDRQRVAVRTEGERRIYSVASTPLDDGAGDLVGYTLVFQDVTEDLRREQRLAVLNRALRHNLRNDMTVVRGFAEAARDASDDDEVVGMLDRVVGKADDLVSLGEKARDVERVMEADRHPEPVDVGDLLAEIATDAATDGVAVAVTASVDDPVTVDRRTLHVVCEALVENAVEHGASDGDTVRLAAERADGAIRISVADDGPGIPENERAVLESGQETDLEHSTGLGLWLASWGCERLGATLSVESGADGGTTATVGLPVESE